MKIAIVLNTSWNIFNFRKGLILGLQKQGHEIIAIAPFDAYSEKLKDLGCKFVKIKMDSRGINPIKDLALFFELLWVYRKCSPDLILHYTAKPNIFGGLAAGILRIPSIANVCGLGTLFLYPGFASKIAMNLYKMAFKFPAKIFFQNSDDRDLFILENLATTEKCHLIPGSGVDLSYFRPQVKVDKIEIHFLLIARIIIDKGIQEFIKAAFILQQKGINVRFSILGQLDPRHKRGISRAQLNEWLDWSNVTYLGFDNDVRPYLAKCDAVVLPSYREGTPKSLLEAAAAGKAIICTNVPGCNQVVKDGENGFLCRERDEKDLAAAMEKFYLLEPAERRQMGRNSRRIAETKFGESKIISIYSHTIDEFFNQKSGNSYSEIQSV